MYFIFKSLSILLYNSSDILLHSLIVFIVPTIAISFSALSFFPLSLLSIYRLPYQSFPSLFLDYVILKTLSFYRNHFSLLFCIVLHLSVTSELNFSYNWNSNGAPCKKKEQLLFTLRFVKVPRTDFRFKKFISFSSHPRLLVSKIFRFPSDFQWKDGY